MKKAREKLTSTQIYLLIGGMALATYLPRALPAVLIEKMKFRGRLRRFLDLIPYTAMAALIFPGILSVQEGNIAYGLVGGAVAALMAWKNCPLILCVLGAILSQMLMYAVL